VQYIAPVEFDRSKLLADLNPEIIVPILDTTKESVVGTIDVDSEYPEAFTTEVQPLFEACADIIQPLWRR
jgi:putative methionine-R-sulfoxide reductase with GAF domain